MQIHSDEHLMQAVILGEGNALAFLVERRPMSMPLSARENPVGPLVGAVLGVAEVFMLILGDSLRNIVPATNITFSALTYKVGETDPGPPLHEVRLPETALIGAGSIGSAFLWGHARETQGRLVIVDHDKLEAHNPDRAILVLDGVDALCPRKATWAHRHNRCMAARSDD